MARRIVIGISGASGAPYAKRLCELLALVKENEQLAPAVVLSRTAAEVWHHECGGSVFDLPFPIYEGRDYNAPFASGSAQYEAMVVIPASMSSIARISRGISDDLLTRSADVMLKERRKLILVARETPLSTIHLENMLSLSKAGAIIMPATPSFYSRPRTMAEVLDTVVSRVLDHLGISNKLLARWGEDLQTAEQEKAARRQSRTSMAAIGAVGGSYPNVTPSGTWSSKPSSSSSRPSYPK